MGIQYPPNPSVGDTIVDDFGVTWECVDAGPPIPEWRKTDVSTYATELARGTIEIADDDEAAAGIDDERAMTPKKVASVISASSPVLSVHGRHGDIYANVGDIPNLGYIGNVEILNPEIDGDTLVFNATTNKYENKTLPSKNVSFDPLQKPTLVIRPSDTDTQVALEALDTQVRQSMTEIEKISRGSQFAGSYDASTNTLSYVNLAGRLATPPFIVGQDIPAAALSIDTFFCRVEVAGTFDPALVDHPNGTPVNVGDTLYCDGLDPAWTISRGATEAPVSSVYGRIGDIVPEIGDIPSLEYIGDCGGYPPAVGDVMRFVGPLFEPQAVKDLAGYIVTGQVDTSPGPYSTLWITALESWVQVRTYGAHGTGNIGNSITLEENGHYLVIASYQNRDGDWETQLRYGVNVIAASRSRMFDTTTMMSVVQVGGVGGSASGKQVTMVRIDNSGGTFDGEIQAPMFLIMRFMP